MQLRLRAKIFMRLWLIAYYTVYGDGNNPTYFMEK
jgi:hypothetical protein